MDMSRCITWPIERIRVRCGGIFESGMDIKKSMGVVLYHPHLMSLRRMRPGWELGA